MDILDKMKVGALSALFASSLMVLPVFVTPVWAKGDNEKSKHSIQCIADQHSVGTNGRISYHILYHNVENKNGSHTWLKVKIPKDLEINADNLEGAEWDAKNGIISWKIKDNDNGAGVVHLNLTVKSGVAAGTTHELSCMLERDGKIVEVSPSVIVRSGTQIDQPFFSGYPDGRFHPERSLTRAEAASVVARIENLSNANQSVIYSDVSSKHWAAVNINKVTNAGYMRGYQDGSFHPDAPITRAELVALVLRIRGVQEIPVPSFDELNGHWAKNIIGTAKELKWIHGIGNGRFDADGHVLRDVAAVMFDIAQMRGPLTDGTAQVVQHFPDVSPASWSYHWVEEASKVAHVASFGADGMEHLIRYLPDQTESF